MGWLEFNSDAALAKIDIQSYIGLVIWALTLKQCIPQFKLVCSLWHTSTKNKNCNIWSWACDSLFCVKPAIKLQLVTKTKSLQMHCTELKKFLIFHAKCFSHKQTKKMQWCDQVEIKIFTFCKKNNNKKQADTMENNWTQIKEQIVPIWPPQSLLC